MNFAQELIFNLINDNKDLVMNAVQPGVDMLDTIINVVTDMVTDNGMDLDVAAIEEVSAEYILDSFIQ